MLKRILIVEDDVLLAMDLAERLQLLGFEVLGPCMTSQAALQLFEAQACDAAILDINLGRETSEAVAISLQSKGVPFVVASGYSTDQYPPIFKDAPAVPKPVSVDALVALLSATQRPAGGDHQPVG